MTTRVPCTPFGKKTKVTMVKQDIPQQEPVKRLGIADSIVNDIIYSCNQCGCTKERIVKTPRIK